MAKACKRCKEVKDLESFLPDKRNKDGKTGYCKTCDNKRRRDNYNPNYRWEEGVRKYGITPDDYFKMIEDQNHCCAICGKHQDNHRRRFSIDHNHTTGKVRGLPSDLCNKSLGGLGDTIEGLERAIEYLRRTDG